MGHGRRFARLLSLLLLPVTGLLGPGTVARAEDAPLPEDGAAVLVGADGILITDLLSAVSKASGAPILWSEQDKAITAKRIKGPARLPVKGREFLDTLRSVLATQEILLLPMGAAEGGFWYATDARMLASQFVLRTKPTWVIVNEGNVAELEGRDGWFVATVIPVENLESLRDARNAMQRIVTANNIGTVQEVPAARAFVVSDFAPNVAAIWRLVKQMDVPTRTPGLRIESFRLSHAKAAAVKALLDGLYPPRVQVPMPQQPGGEVSLGGPYVMADEPTNQVFVRASAPDLTAVRAVIEALDVPPAK